MQRIVLNVWRQSSAEDASVDGYRLSLINTGGEVRATPVLSFTLDMDLLMSQSGAVRMPSVSVRRAGRPSPADHCQLHDPVPGFWLGVTQSTPKGRSGPPFRGIHPCQPMVLALDAGMGLEFTFTPVSPSKRPAQTKKKSSSPSCKRQEPSDAADL